MLCLVKLPSMYTTMGSGTVPSPTLTHFQSWTEMSQITTRITWVITLFDQSGMWLPHWPPLRTDAGCPRPLLLQTWSAGDQWSVSISSLSGLASMYSLSRGSCSEPGSDGGAGMGRWEFRKSVNTRISQCYFGLSRLMLTLTWVIPGDIQTFGDNSTLPYLY